MTTASGTIVVYRPVGETPGTCWIQAVNKKNRLADLENSAEKSAHCQGSRLRQLTEQELGQEGNRSIFPSRHRVVLKSLDLISSRVIQTDLSWYSVEFALPPK